ncbi:MAG: hypothetical protein HY033_04540 [Ignavibacteriae bacterium]|nr:hypothetical protein [Ignavibacteria bacterium]MBI3364157.1 hypothetical protein [Ignavibacteriota bacterium]
MRTTKIFFLLAITLMMNASLSYGAEGRKSSGKPLQKVTGTGPFSTLVNINNISMWISYDGQSARNPSTGNAGVTYPRGSGTAIFADGLIWGGLVHDGGTQVLRTNGQTYQSGMVGGAIVSKGVAENPGDQSVRIFRIRRDWATADLRQDAAELLDKPLKDVTDGDIAQVRAQYETDWAEWPWQKGAPYYDRDGDNTYTPAINPNTGKVTYDPTKDEPGVADADQVVWFVMNDLNSAQSQSFLGSDPIGLEVQTTLWGYARTDQLGNVIFKKFKFIYKGTASTPANARVDSMLIGQWADPDLGDFSDDYEGCDTSLSLGFVYNSTTIDANYRTFGLAPPSVGYDFFAGPIVPSTGDSAVFDLKRRYGFKNLPMTSWIYFAAGGTFSDPPFSYVGAVQWYNLLRGLTPINGAPFSYPGGGVTKFWLSGDPVKGTGYLDGTIDAPGDRRMMLSSGPFTMALGDTQDIVVAMVAGIGSDVKSGISVLKYNDLSAQFAYNNLFDLPKAPPAPKIRVSELDKSVVLNWGFDDEAIDATEYTVNKGYAFEGYNVYQLPTQSAKKDEYIKIATYDLVNEVTTILDDTFDPASGQVLQRPVQIGTNSGVKRYLKIITDRVREKPLVNGQTYFFAVTAYNNNSDPNVPVHSLESQPQILRVIPHSADPGIRYTSSVGDTVQVQHSGGSDGIITPIVVEPSKVTGHTYSITFSIDTTDGSTVWALTDTTTHTTILTHQTNQSGDDNYLIVDGIHVKVAGPPPGMKDWAIPSGARRWTFADADGNGFEGFFGAIGWDDPSHFFNGTPRAVPAEHLKNVLVKLAEADGTWDRNTVADSNFSYAYRYLRRANQPAAKPEFAPYIINPGPGYAYQEYKKSVPFSAWDVEADPPRRLAVGHLENNRPGGLVDGRYWPPPNGWDYNNTESDGPREWFFIFDEPYTDATPDINLEKDIVSNPLPVMWWGTVNRRGGANFHAGDQFLILANHVNSTSDIFTFTAPAVTASQALAKVDVNKINIYPNPYYGYNRAETSRFARFVTFNHLPPGDWRIRIIALDGLLVRYIDPNSAQQSSASQFATWDLNNQNGLPVASGIYIAYVEMPSLGVTKTLKVVIIQEQQVLDYY